MATIWLGSGGLELSGKPDHGLHFGRLERPRKVEGVDTEGELRARPRCYLN